MRIDSITRVLVKHAQDDKVLLDLAGRLTSVSSYDQLDEPARAYLDVEVTPNVKFSLCVENYDEMVFEGDVATIYTEGL